MQVQTGGARLGAEVKSVEERVELTGLVRNRTNVGGGTAAGREPKAVSGLCFWRWVTRHWCVGASESPWIKWWSSGLAVTARSESQRKSTSAESTGNPCSRRCILASQQFTLFLKSTESLQTQGAFRRTGGRLEAGETKFGGWRRNAADRVGSHVCSKHAGSGWWPGGKGLLLTVS
jgi:hypothetical protein